MVRGFSQVDVFTDTPLLGNPLAVVHDGSGLTDDQLAAFARWTNLSETTFLLPPTDPAADYRVRIFTPSEEFPFAGHPTLGSAAVWLSLGGEPKHPDRVVQECGVGLVTVRRDGSRLAFAAPPLIRSGPVERALVDRIVDGCGLRAEDVVGAAWTDNGPGWISLELVDAERVLAAEPDSAALVGLKFGLVGRHRDPVTAGADVEVRALFEAGQGIREDPVTGSLNAGIAQWLIGSGRLPSCYVASQGSRVHRNGRVYVERIDDEIWVGGNVVPLIEGTVNL